MTFRPPKKPALTLDASLVQDDLPLEVVPKVFIGSIHSAFNAESLHHNGITHILNASRLPITFPKLFTYLSVEIRDRDTSNILACIPTTNIFIEAGLECGGVLVHCFGGKSRSAAFVCAYIMSSLNWSFDEAYATLKAARPIVEINAGFECQLRAYHAAGCDVYLAQQLLLRTRIRTLREQRAQRIEEGDKGSAQSKAAGENGTVRFQSDGSRGGSSGAAGSSSGGGSGGVGNTGIMPQLRGLRLDTKESSVTTTSGAAMDEGEGMEVVSTEGQAPMLRPLINTASSGEESSSGSGGNSPEEPKYDSFYYQRDHNMLPEGSKPVVSISKLATQVEDVQEGDEFTFSKTRSISDVYRDSHDPCLDACEDGAVDPREEEERATYAMLQKRHQYVADSPSGALQMQMHLQQGGLAPQPGGHSLLPNFGSAHSTPGSTGSGGSAGGGSGGGLQGLSAGLNIGLNIGTAQEPSGGDGFHAPTRSIGVGYMQGSGNSAGNRTHRAGAQKNRAGRKGRSAGSSGSSSGEVESATPACRLSRPGSTVVRVMPPLRGLERQFRCSWCNTALFTTANVLRTDLDLRAVLENFHCAHAATGAAGGNSGSGGAAKTERFSVEEYLAQEKARLGRNNDLSGADAKQEQHTPPKHPPTAAGQPGGEHSPLSARLGESKDGENSPPPRILPLIRANSGNMAPVSARGSDAKTSDITPAGAKDDTSSLGGGRFPPIYLNRSNSSSRNNSSGNLNLLRSGGGSGSNLLQSTSADHTEAAVGGRMVGMEMDVDSPPKTEIFAPPTHRRGNNANFASPAPSAATTLSSAAHAAGFDSDEDDHHIMAAPKFPMGGLKTSKAGHSKAFDFDLPMDTDHDSSSGGGGGGGGAEVSSGAATRTNFSTARPVPIVTEDSASAEHSGSFKYGIADRRPSRDDTALGESLGSNSGASESRRNSSGQPLPMLLHSKTTPTSLSQKPGSSPFQADYYSPANNSQKTSPRGENLPHNPARGLTHLNVPGVGGVGIAGMNSVHAPASNSATFLHGLGASASPHSTTSSARSDDSPSPRIHIPPHRLQQAQQQQQAQLNAALSSASPRSQALFQQYPRPQSAEKRRWLARMNLLRHASGGSSGSTHEGGVEQDGTAMLVDAHAGSGGGGGIGYGGSGGSGDYKVARLAEADDVASQLVYGGPEKYFHIEYLEWMGSGVFQAGVDEGEICCFSCKNVLGRWLWNPSSRLTMGGKLEAPIFRVHKHVVHQADLPFDATPSSTPRIDERSRKTIEGSPQV